MNITAVHRITGQFTEHDNLNKDLQTSYNQEHYHYHQPCQDNVNILPQLDDMIVNDERTMNLGFNT